MTDRTTGSTRRASDWLVALWMIAGGLFAAALCFAFIGGTAGTVIGCVAFWPGAFIAGAWAVRGEVRRKT